MLYIDGDNNAPAVALAAAANVGAIYAATVKLPDFWQHNQRSWFQHIESKVTRHTKAPLALFKVPERRFDHVNVDLVGPLSPSRGYTYLLTMVDRTTRWPEGWVPLSSTTAAEVARAFVMAWVACFGTPSDLSSDRGPQFTSELWTAVAGVLGLVCANTKGFVYNSCTLLANHLCGN